MSGAMAEAATGFGDEAEKEGFVLVSPDGLGDPKGWNVGYLDLGLHHADDVRFIELLIARIQAEVGIDAKRIYVVGHSNGAMLAELVGSKLGYEVAAIAAVAGTIGLRRPDGSYDEIPKPADPVSVLLIHGVKDPMVGYGSDSSAMLKGVGALEAAQWWAAADGAGDMPLTETSQNGNLVTRTYTGGRSLTEVELLTILNGAHEWPGGLLRTGREKTTGVNATELIWTFLQAHSKP
jgi:polyhydroxybutyrate depolymerase